MIGFDLSAQDRREAERLPYRSGDTGGFLQKSKSAQLRTMFFPHGHSELVEESCGEMFLKMPGNNSFAKSLNAGFVFLTSASFLFRDQVFSCFSRFMASSGVLYTS